MDKELLKKSIEDVEKSLNTSRENLVKVQQHIDEGEVILKALNAEMKLLGKPNK